MAKDYAHSGDDELIAQSDVLESEALQMEDELYSKAYRNSAKQVSYDLRKKWLGVISCRWEVRADKKAGLFYKIAKLKNI